MNAAERGFVRIQFSGSEYTGEGRRRKADKPNLKTGKKKMNETALIPL